MNHFGYTLADFIPCEICGGQATEIHHLEPKKWEVVRQKTT
jgi:hypothetical protein